MACRIVQSQIVAECSVVSLDPVGAGRVSAFCISGRESVHSIPYVESCRRTSEDPLAGVKVYPWLM